VFTSCLESVFESYSDIYFVKTIRRLYRNVRDIVLNNSISDFLIRHNFQYGALLYGIIATNPTQVAVSVIALKLGLSRSVIVLILLFLV